MYKRLLSLTCISVMLSGCMTMYNIGVATKNNTVTDTQVTGQDVIYQFSYIQLPNQNDKALVLLGYNYSYKVSKGLSSLQQLPKLDDEYIHLLPPVNITRFDNNHFDAKIDFDYKKSSQQYTSREVSALNEICQKVDIKSQKISQFYKCQIRLKGELYQPISVSNSDYDDKYQLKVDIIEEVRTNKRHYGRLAALPLAVTTDIVTSPLQLLWIGSALASPFTRN